MQSVVSQWKQEEFTSYPSEAPYHPSIRYPEYKGLLSTEKNRVYEGFRNALHQIGLDKKHYGTPDWNPLGFLIQPGNSVVIKPNFVLDRNEGTGTIYSVITHPSLIRAVVDYAYIALKGNGLIIIGDASQADCDYEKVLNLTKISTIKEYYKNEYGFDIEIDDFRQVKYAYHNGVLDENSRVAVNGDPRGYTIFDLGENSFIEKLEHPERIYGADYDRSEIREHHSEGHHQYCISSTIISADVVISMPKMKTHKKAGVTINLKNLVGINGNKNFLPHFRIGDPSQGGDEFQQLNQEEKIRKKASRGLIDHLLVNPNSFKTFIYNCIRNTYLFFRPLIVRNSEKKHEVSAGSWYGNDTIWRMILDLNQILWHGKKDGTIDPAFERKTFCVVDGFIAGEGEGPMAPDDRVEGLVTIGANPLATDIACINYMGFDYQKIPLYREAVRNGFFGIGDAKKDIQILSNSRCSSPFSEPGGWKEKMIVDDPSNVSL